MMRETFALTCEQKIVIYGASTNGIFYAHLFMDNGFSISYFIDVQAEKMGNSVRIGEQNFPIYTIKNVPEEAREDYIVYIAIRNAMEQEKCVEMARNLGYQKIIYLPLHKKTVETAEGIDALTRVYNEIILGNINGDILCPMQSYFQVPQYRDVAFIKCNEKIISYVPLDIIYYHSYAQIKEMNLLYGIPTNEEIDRKYSNCPFPQVDFFKEMFLFFLTGRGNIKKYMDVTMKLPNNLKACSDDEHQEWLDDRKHVIEKIIEKGFYENEFWINSAIPIEWNAGGFFNIQDGIHRYFVADMLSMRKIPAQIKKEDYDIWLNKKALHKCLKYVQNIKVLPTPVSHPYFLDCDVESELLGKTVLKYIQEKVASIWNNQIKILDTNPQIGYYTQHFVRMGGNVTAIMDVNDKYYDVFCSLNELAYLEDRISISGFIDAKHYDIILCMKNWDMFEDKGHYKEWLKLIKTLTPQLMIWESGVVPEEEKKIIFQYTQFSEYEFLRYVLEDKIIREVGIFK